MSSKNNREAYDAFAANKKFEVAVRLSYITLRPLRTIMGFFGCMTTANYDVTGI